MSNLFEKCKNGDIEACKEIQEKTGMEVCVFKKNWNGTEVMMACSGKIDPKSLNNTRDIYLGKYP